MQAQQQTHPNIIQGLHLRIMTQIRHLENNFLQFQVGQFIEHRPSRPPYYGEPLEPEWLFHLRGFGSTREAALAMAGLSSTTRLHEEIH